MSKPRNLLYVGGLENDVTEDILFAAFVPFGPLRSVQIPKDFKESKDLDRAMDAQICPIACKLMISRSNFPKCQPS